MHVLGLSSLTLVSSISQDYPTKSQTLFPCYRRMWRTSRKSRKIFRPFLMIKKPPLVAIACFESDWADIGHHSLKIIATHVHTEVKQFITPEYFLSSKSDDSFSYRWNILSDCGTLPLPTMMKGSYFVSRLSTVPFRDFFCSPYAISSWIFPIMQYWNGIQEE